MIYVGLVIKFIAPHLGWFDRLLAYVPGFRRYLFGLARLLYRRSDGAVFKSGMLRECDAIHSSRNGQERASGRFTASKRLFVRGSAPEPAGQRLSGLSAYHRIDKPKEPSVVLMYACNGERMD